MTDNPDLWEVRRLPDGLALELWGGGNPAVVLVQGERRVRVDLPHIKGVVAALTADVINGKKVQYPGWDLERVVPLCLTGSCSLVQKVREG